MAATTRTSSTTSQPTASPVTVHADPIGNPQIHIAPLNTYRLVIVGSNGEKYPIPLKPEQRARFEQLCARLHGEQGNQLHFAVDLQELTVENGNEAQLYSNHPDVLALRQFVHDEWRSDFSWSTQLPGHRTSASAETSFVHTSPRLKALKFGETETEKALQGKPFNQKLIQLKRSRAAQYLLETTGKILDDVSALVPNGSLQSANRKAQLLKQKELLDDRLKAVLQFEAFHATDATKQALKDKQTAAKAWIESHSDISFGERLLQGKLSTIDANEETHFAEDLARLGCKTKEEYKMLGAKDRAEGPEVFYARVMEAVVAGNRDEIRSVVNGPLFDVVFAGLNGEDRDLIKERLIARTEILRQNLELSDAEVARLTQVPDAADRENFGKGLSARYNLIVNPKLNP